MAVTMAAAGAAPAPIEAQDPDWVFDVDLQISSLPPQVAGVQVRCLVSPESLDANVATMLSGQFSVR